MVIIRSETLQRYNMDEADPEPIIKEPVEPKPNVDIEHTDSEPGLETLFTNPTEVYFDERLSATPPSPTGLERDREIEEEDAAKFTSPITAYFEERLSMIPPSPSREHKGFTSPVDVYFDEQLPETPPSPTGHLYQFKSATDELIMRDLSRTPTPPLDDEKIFNKLEGEYLKTHLGVPLTLALAEIISKKPTDPIHYLGHWLFKWRYNQEYEQEMVDKVNELTMERARIADELVELKRLEAERLALLEAEEEARKDAEMMRDIMDKLMQQSLAVGEMGETGPGYVVPAVTPGEDELSEA